MNPDQIRPDQSDRHVDGQSTREEKVLMNSSVTRSKSRLRDVRNAHIKRWVPTAFN